MTKVPRPQEPVDQWCQQFKPSFLIQGLLDTFKTGKSSDVVEHLCFACQQIGKKTAAKSICEDCNILFCEACAKIHQAIPVLSGHVISPRETGFTTQLNKRKAICKEHNCLVEFCCKDCQKAVCHKCCIVNHRKCHSVVALETMTPEMKEVLQQTRDQINSNIRQAGKTLKRKRSQFEEITQQKALLQSEIKRVGQQAVDLVRRKEKKLLDELDTLTEQQTGQLRSQIKSGEIDLQTYQQYIEFIKQTLQSKSPVDLYDMYTLCLSAEIQKTGKQEDYARNVLFENHLNVDQFDETFQLGHLKYVEDKSNLNYTPKPLYTVSAGAADDTASQYLTDIEVVDIDGLDTLVVTDLHNKSLKSCYFKGGKPHCTSLKLCETPCRLTKISQDRVAVSHWSHNSFDLIDLTPDPVRITTIKTKKKYTCLTALSDTTLAAGCGPPPCIDVLDLSGRVLSSVITPGIGQQPWYMCTTRQGHIVVTDRVSGFVCCVTQQGEIVFTYKLRGYGATTTDTGSVIVADYRGNKIVQLTERGEYVRDLLTRQDGILEPYGIRVNGNKLYVTEGRKHIKIFQL